MKNYSDEAKFAMTIAIAKRARNIIAEKEVNGELLEQNAIKLAIEDFKNNVCKIVSD